MTIEGKYMELPWLGVQTFLFKNFDFWAFIFSWIDLFLFEHILKEIIINLHWK